MINIGGSIGELYVGSTEIAKAYVGSQLVYEKASEHLYDSEIAYLQSDGNQWVETDILLNMQGKSCTLRTDWYVLSNSTATFPCGSTGADWANAYGHFRTGSNWAGYLRPSYGVMGLSNKATKANVALAIVQNTTSFSLYQSGTRVYNSTGTNARLSNINSTVPLYVFCYNNNGVATNISTMRFIRCYCITNGGEYLFDIVPVRKGNVGYIYDRVSGKMWGNAGSGSFILGADV